MKQSNLLQSKQGREYYVYRVSQRVGARGSAAAVAADSDGKRNIPNERKSYAI